ncbi:hypothetical protein [Bacteroides thetaiotaomicron]|uniref:Uncharacterized protein n=1 Tax=Bacteroides thetaiotaomicron TaxID=818 RepID=A0A943DW94_BACT4|nr:hypothetical protein [Bacteroides thetaiotaomicron]MBS5410793.1 hypothetical protein [Bacteroides thetaiotaomicron]MDC2233484.1 hypothetical protein [Bacteroides thetaiotaomicron]
MKETAITFTKGEKNYASNAVQVNSAEVGLQIAFEKGGKLWVYISYDGQNFSVVESRSYTKDFARPVVGCIPGQYIKIECETEPVKASIFESEE